MLLYTKRKLLPNNIYIYSKVIIEILSIIYYYFISIILNFWFKNSILKTLLMQNLKLLVYVHKIYNKCRLKYMYNFILILWNN